MEIQHAGAVGLVTVVLLVIVAALWIVKNATIGFRKPQTTTVPGLEMSHPELGNFPDIAKAGSLHQFLMALHQKYGDIVSFWWGKQMTVSICSPELFKQNSRLFDRPPAIFELFQPFLTEHSILYASGPEAQARHVAYSRCFNETAMVNYYAVIRRTTHEVIDKLKSLPEYEHVSLREYMLGFAVKTILLCVYGEHFENDEEVLKLQRSFDNVWGDLERQLTGCVLVKGSERMSQFQEECDKIFNLMRSILDRAKQNPSLDPSRSSFLDVISSLDISMEEKTADMVSVFVAGLHITGLLLTWGIYHLASHPDVQQKAAKEVDEVVGKQQIGPETINQLVYLRQVIDETLRCSVMAPYAGRYTEEETQLGGHHIAGGTPIIHALGVSLHDPVRWPQPQLFDPDRFSPSNRKKIPAFGFEPFGFAGKRKCMGFRFSVVADTMLLANVLREFSVELVPGQEILPVHGLLTEPSDEIWVKFKKRN